MNDTSLKAILKDCTVLDIIIHCFAAGRNWSSMIIFYSNYRSSCNMTILGMNIAILKENYLFAYFKLAKTAPAGLGKEQGKVSYSPDLSTLLIISKFSLKGSHSQKLLVQFSFFFWVFFVLKSLLSSVGLLISGCNWLKYKEGNWKLACYNKILELPNFTAFITSKIILKRAE